jgi:hypothetical protein
MHRRNVPIDLVSQISLDPQPQGTNVVYLVDTRNEQEAREISRLFEELKTHLQIRQLTRGKMMSYAVQVQGVDGSMLNELEALLKNKYVFVVMHRSFDPVIYRVVRELASDTGSKLLPIPHCNICGKPEPFPEVVINLADQEGETLSSRTYCSTCTAGSTAKSTKDFVISLLAADQTEFSSLSKEQLVRSRTRKQSIRYKVKLGADGQCAVAH